MQRLRPLNEQECYLRCYGWVGGDDAVRVTRPGSEAPVPEETAVLTERIRLAFEARFAEHEAEAA
jgi:hypothetical protein